LNLLQQAHRGHSSPCSSPTNACRIAGSKLEGTEKLEVLIFGSY
jgi:hypothetical protein